MLRNFLRLLFARGDNVSVEGLVARAAVILLIGGIIGVSVAQLTSVEDEPTALTVAHNLAREGSTAEAEEVLWNTLQRGPAVTMDALAEYLAFHATESQLRTLAERFARTDVALPPRPPRSEAEVVALLESPRLSPAVALMGRFLHGLGHGNVNPVDHAALARLADGAGAPAWSNRLLGRYALEHEDLAAAAARFEREGRLHPEHAEDLALATSLWVELKAWETLAEKLRDPVFAEKVPEHVHLQVALKTRNWREAVRWFLPASLPSPSHGPLSLAIINAVMWFFFLARVGGFRERPTVRVPLGLLAVVAGAVSVLPVLALVHVMDGLWGIRPDGTPMRDLFYYVVGVGFREELCKALFALPFVILLRRFGTRQDALALGAMVGLGFAAEENLMYFERGGVGTALVRFLVSNPLHCFATGLMAVATWDFLHSRGKRLEELSNTFLIVVVMHGLFDFLLSSNMMEGLSYLSMTVFVLLVRRFLAEVNRTRRGNPLLPLFVNAVAVVTAASFVYACTVLPPGAAFMAMLAGLIGEALIVYVFVHELDRL